MQHWWIYLLLVIVAVGAAISLFGSLRRRARAKHQHRAVTEFPVLRELMEKKFFNVAAASGKPRGLRWKQCDFHEGHLFAIDRVSRELFAFVEVTISFEAIEGGDMEDVEAVGNLRAATAVFTHRGGEWTTAGRAVFNLSPEETLQRYAEWLDALSAYESARLR